MLANALKDKTFSQHQQLEKLLIGKIKSVNTSTAYVDLLQLFYSYFGGLEEKIKDFIKDDQLPDQALRRKTDSLLKDIEDLGGVPIAKMRDADLPVIDSAAKAFGALYVIEGSTLGGSIISKMIRARTGLNTGLSFFNGYGADSLKMWEVFKETLNKLPATDEPFVIEAANDTFGCFETSIRNTDTVKS